MAKDPAFLFYFRDFLVSTELMTAEEVGLYIRILCHMADKGRLTKEHMQSICKAHGIAQALHNKLKVDEKGLFYNTRLEEEVIKRSNYTQSRRENAKHMHKHMGNANANEDKDIIKKDRIVKGRKQRFVKPTIEQVKQYCVETKSKIDPEAFWHNYESTGWIKANGQSVKNWKSTIKTWEKRDERTGTHNQNTENDLERIERKKQLDSLGTEISNVLWQKSHSSFGPYL